MSRERITVEQTNMKAEKMLAQEPIVPIATTIFRIDDNSLAIREHVQCQIIHAN